MESRQAHKLVVLGLSFGIIVLGTSKLFNFILKLAVSRLGVEGFGDYYLLTSTFGSLVTLCALGLPMSVTRFVSYYHSQKNDGVARDAISTALTISAVLTLIVTVITFTAADAVANLLGIPHITQYLRIISMGITGALLTTFGRAMLMGFLRVRASYLLESVDIFGKFLFVFVAITILGLGLQGAIWAFALASITTGLINAYLAIHLTNLRGISARISGTLTSYSWPVSVSEVLTAGTATALMYMVRAWGSSSDLGYYAAAVSLASLLHLAPNMILSVFLPLVSSLHAEGKSILSTYKTILLWLFPVVAIPAVILFAISPLLIGGLFGPLYQNAVDTMRYLIVAYGLYAVVVWPLRQLLDMAGYTKLNLVLTTVRSCVSIVALLHPSVGFTSAGLSIAVLFGWAGEAVGSVLFVLWKRVLWLAPHQKPLFVHPFDHATAGPEYDNRRKRYVHHRK